MRIVIVLNETIHFMFIRIKVQFIDNLKEILFIRYGRVKQFHKFDSLTVEITQLKYTYTLVTCKTRINDSSFGFRFFVK